NSVTVKLKLVRAVNADIPVSISLTESGVVYGTDYTTTPAVNTATNKLELTVPSGASEVSFKLDKVAGALFDGDEKIDFEIYSSGSPVLIGIRKSLTVSFAEIVSPSATVVLDGGGATYPNKVFV